MSSITDFEKQKILEFFTTLDNGAELVENIVKTIFKKDLSLSFDESIKTICVQSTSIYDILSRKIISKKILFKYLINFNICVPSNPTKTNLIDKVIEFWKTTSVDKEKANTAPAKLPDEFPINKMAKQFSQWFFDNLNKNTLQSTDFWSDVKVNVKIIANNNVSEEQFEGNSNIHNELRLIREKYSLYFNPNLFYEGVQGRIDPHGLVLILTCGTLHTQNECVGIFEVVFGLAKDPFAENNWKIRSTKLELSNKCSKTPSLNESDNLQSLMLLPINENNL